MPIRSFYMVSAVLLLAIGSGLFTASYAITETEPSGYEIAKRSHERYIADDESTELWLLLINNRGGMRKRRLIRFRKSFPDHKSVAMKFFYPEDIRNTGVLNVERPQEKYDTQFLYLPAVKKLRRMSSANKEQRWVGSDFFFEDIQEIKLNEWDYKRLADDTFDGADCYLVEWLPKSGSDTVYARQVRWYRKDGYLPVRIDYFDAKGNLWKRFTATDLRNVQDVQTAWIVAMEDFQTSHKSIMYRRWMIYDAGLPDDYFSTRNLEKDVSTYSMPSDLWGLIDRPSEYDSKAQ